MTPIPPVSAQAEAVRKLFLRHGFTGIQCSEQEVFVLGLVNEALDTERASHMFTVPAVKLANGALQVEAGLAGFSSNAPVPEAIQARAWTILAKLCAQLERKLSVPCVEPPAPDADLLHALAPRAAGMRQVQATTD
ncbi:hypothetical protein ABU162_21900 [Paenibacillus thiaminolyticus]|uniref:hypothetical protein n=1 Tax=Paenibacillus thiaminolyticus TaxID=49283 RepID=UPI0035A73E34